MSFGHTSLEVRLEGFDSPTTLVLYCYHPTERHQTRESPPNPGRSTIACRRRSGPSWHRSRRRASAASTMTLIRRMVWVRLTDLAREVIRTSPWVGEGHIKVWARLRDQGGRAAARPWYRASRQALYDGLMERDDLLGGIATMAGPPARRRVRAPSSTIRWTRLTLTGPSSKVRRQNELADIYGDVKRLTGARFSPGSQPHVQDRSLCRCEDDERPHCVHVAPERAGLHRFQRPLNVQRHNKHVRVERVIANESHQDRG